MKTSGDSEKQGFFLKILIRRWTNNLIFACLAAIFTLAVLRPLAEPANAAALRQAQGSALRPAPVVVLRQAPVAVPRQAREDQLVEAPVVQLSPSALDLPVGGSGTLSLEVLGGVEINAYDVTVRYDPALITFVSWSHGGYLSRLAQVYKADEPGKLRLVFTQLATPPVSGDGILLNLVFRGAAEGVSEVLIEALDFAGSDGTITNPQLIGATVVVTAALPTAAATPTLTLPPPANTPIATATQGLAVIATPDLTRTSPVSGTATPTRGLTVVTPPIEVSISSATSFATEIAAVNSLYPPSNSTPVAVPTAAPVAVPRQVREDQPAEALLNLALWAALIVFAIAFVWLAVIAIRRNKTQSSDKE